MFPDFWLIALEFIDLFAYLRKNISYCLRSNTSEAMHEWISGFCMQLNSSDTGTILTAVVLLLHQQVEFIQSI